MYSNNSLAQRPAYALDHLRDADVLRIGAIVLSTLDRFDGPAFTIARLVVYGRRVIVIDLTDLGYTAAYGLAANDGFGSRLSHLIDAQLITIRPAQPGCRIIVDLGGPLPARRTAQQPVGSLIYCQICGRLMPREHTHLEQGA